MARTKTYTEKRSFAQTPEPAAAITGDVDPGTAPAGKSFVIHQHHATRLHFDLRLEMMNGDVPVLVSWAVPKNLPLAPGEKHLAVHVEDHPFDYGSFSGTIPPGNYGAGEVRIFDAGTYELLEQEPRKLTFRLRGRRMQGVWHLIQTTRNEGKDWLVWLRTSERPPSEPRPKPLPMLATLVQEAFDDDGWLFELKWDGIRAFAVCSDETTLFSRTARDITPTYPELGKLHERTVAIDAVLDGEIVAMSGGRPSFELLQSRMNLQDKIAIAKVVKQIPVAYMAFDLLYLDGRSLLSTPIEQRKALLEEVVVLSDRVQVSPTVEAEGTAVFQAARAQNLEGVVAKKLGSPYRPGKRSKEWLKIKTILDADVVIGGWTKGEGARSNTIGALLVGAYEGPKLRYAGSVGTGFSDRSLDELLTSLREVQAAECPFADDPSGSRNRLGKVVKNPTWTTPVLVARVEFRELTSAGRLRAPSFKGLRQDKRPEDCLFEDLFPRPRET
ncbi:MAG: non-homologous end-joining DNA ligase [Actinomycetota bacterium]|nr:non-homologous end-joining DNA ligase [Actinomycetota bacterium]